MWTIWYKTLFAAFANFGHCRPYGCLSSIFMPNCLRFIFFFNRVLICTQKKKRQPNWLCEALGQQWVGDAISMNAAWGICFEMEMWKRVHNTPTHTHTYTHTRTKELEYSFSAARVICDFCLAKNQLQFRLKAGKQTCRLHFLVAYSIEQLMRMQ